MTCETLTALEATATCPARKSSAFSLMNCYPGMHSDILAERRRIFCGSLRVCNQNPQSVAKDEEEKEKSQRATRACVGVLGFCFSLSFLHKFEARSAQTFKISEPKESVLEAHLFQKYNATPTPQIHAPPPRYLGRCCSLVKKISARFERNVSL